MPCFIVHGDDVFHGGVDLQIVARGENVPRAVAGQRVNAMTHLGANFRGGSERQDALVLDC